MLNYDCIKHSIDRLHYYELLNKVSARINIRIDIYIDIYVDVYINV